MVQLWFLPKIRRQWTASSRSQPCSEAYSSLDYPGIANVSSSPLPLSILSSRRNKSFVARSHLHDNKVLRSVSLGVVHTLAGLDREVKSIRFRNLSAGGRRIARTIVKARSGLVLLTSQFGTSFMISFSLLRLACVLLKASRSASARIIGTR